MYICMYIHIYPCVYIEHVCKYVCIYVNIYICIYIHNTYIWGIYIHNTYIWGVSCARLRLRVKCSLCGTFTRALCLSLS